MKIITILIIILSFKVYSNTNENCLSKDINDSCSKLSKSYLIKKDILNAKKYSKFGCEKGDSYSCLVYDELLSMEINKSERMDLLSKTCNEIKNGEACYRKAQIDYSEENFYSALEYFKKGCDLKHGEACAGYAVLGYSKEKLKYYEARAFIYKSCELNSVFGCKIKSEYKDISAKKIEELNKFSCEHGEISSCKNYIKSFNISSKSTIYNLFKKACITSKGKACYDAAKEMEELKISKSRIVELLNHGCESQNSQSCFMLSSLEKGGNSVKALEDACFFSKSPSERLSCYFTASKIVNSGGDKKSAIPYLLKGCDALNKIDKKTNKLTKDLLNASCARLTIYPQFKETYEDELEKMALTCKNDSFNCYDVACIKSIRGYQKEAAIYLSMAIKSDSKMYEWAKKDPDLEKLRRSRDWSKLRSIASEGP